MIILDSLLGYWRERMKQQLEQLIHSALKQLHANGALQTIPASVQVEPTKDKQHGDFASNIALMLAKPLQKKPREVAEQIINALPKTDYVQKVEMAGPGFINFFLTTTALNSIVATILQQKTEFGRSKMGQAKRVIIEFVSSNPTGPLHVGHGRHAAFGAVVGNLLDAVGFHVYREYYVNDAGRQMDILTVSAWLRYLTLNGENIIFPANGYQGDYIIDIARILKDKYNTEFCAPVNQVLENLPLDAPEGGDKELYIDALIERAKNILGYKFETILDVVLENIIHDIADDLAEFGVHFDNYYSERKMVATGKVDKLIEVLRENNRLYEREGALWFRSTDFGDDKDRVLVRSNGQRTYFANDAAYHFDKFTRGFDIAIDVFGSDHHGYLARMKALVQAVGIDSERLISLLGQFVKLYRNGEEAPMSTRSGTFVTLRELREEVGNDVTRYFYVMRKYDQPIDFDLDLAKSQSNENPVYYLQYAFARISSVFKQLKERQITFNEVDGIAHLDLLTAPQEREVLNTLARYPDIIVNAALHYEPHVLTNYLRDLATAFHAYYNSHQFIVEDKTLRDARLALVLAVKQVLLNGFHLLGVSAPETM